MDVTFGPLSVWQKPDCINRSAQFNCTNSAVQEARVSDGGRLHIGVRCCDQQACMDRAAELAQTQFNAWMDERHEGV